MIKKLYSFQEFNPASEREFIETEEPSRNPKQEEEEANREIQEQSRQMGIDPSKAGHETRTGLDYPTSQDRITKHNDEYIEKGEEDIPSVILYRVMLVLEKISNLLWAYNYIC